MYELNFGRVYHVRVYFYGDIMYAMKCKIAPIFHHNFLLG